MKTHLVTPLLNREVILRASVYTADKRSIYLDSRDAETGEPVYTITSFVDEESPFLTDTQILVKNYSENRGLAEAMILAGLGRIARDDSMFVRFEVTNPELLALMNAARTTAAVK